MRRWVNEIQNWGLGKHGGDVKLDIKGILRALDGEECVSLLPDDMARPGLETEPQAE